MGFEPNSPVASNEIAIGQSNGGKQRSQSTFENTLAKQGSARTGSMFYPRSSQLNSANKQGKQSPQNGSQEQNGGSDESGIEDLKKTMGINGEDLRKIKEFLASNGYHTNLTILGKGGTAFVVQALKDRNQLAAIKIVKCKNADQLHNNTQEFENLRKFHSKHITRVRDFLRFSINKTPFSFLVMELCSSDLKQYMNETIRHKVNPKPIEKKTLYQICLQCVAGLREFHRNNLLHLDIKPANILLGIDNNWKYTDLGISKNISLQRDHTESLKGLTAFYASPEQYQVFQFESHKKISKQSDIYSLGIVFMELTGVDVKSSWAMKIKVSPQPFDEFLNSNYSSFNTNVLKRMLEYRPNLRPELHELENILKYLLSAETKDSKQQGSSPLAAKQKQLQHNSYSTASAGALSQPQLLQPQQSQQPKASLSVAEEALRRYQQSKSPQKTLNRDNQRMQSSQSQAQLSSNSLVMLYSGSGGDDRSSPKKRISIKGMASNMLGVSSTHLKARIASSHVQQSQLQNQQQQLMYQQQQQQQAGQFSTKNSSVAAAAGMSSTSDNNQIDDSTSVKVNRYIVDKPQYSFWEQGEANVDILRVFKSSYSDQDNQQIYAAISPQQSQSQAQLERYSLKSRGQTPIRVRSRVLSNASIPQQQQQLLSQRAKDVYQQQQGAPSSPLKSKGPMIGKNAAPQSMSMIYSNSQSQIVTQNDENSNGNSKKRVILGNNKPNSSNDDNSGGGIKIRRNGSMPELFDSQKSFVSSSFADEVQPLSQVQIKMMEKQQKGASLHAIYGANPQGLSSSSSSTSQQGQIMMQQSGGQSVSMSSSPIKQNIIEKNFAMNQNQNRFRKTGTIQMWKMHELMKPYNYGQISNGISNHK